jgi:hypothetical protein
MVNKAKPYKRASSSITKSTLRIKVKQIRSSERAKVNKQSITGKRNNTREEQFYKKFKPEGNGFKINVNVREIMTISRSSKRDTVMKTK